MFLTDRLHPTGKRLITDLVFLLSVAVLIGHLYAARKVMLHFNFTKYTQAAALYGEGRLPRQRITDFSPLYLGTHIAAAGLVAEPAKWIIAMQLAMAVAALFFLFWVLRHFFSAAAALAGAFAFALYRGVPVHALIPEQEMMLLFMMLGFVFFLYRRDRFAPVAAGIFLALALLLRPTMLLMMLVVPLFFYLNGARSRRWIVISGSFLAAPLAAVVLLCGLNVSTGGGFSPAVMNPGNVFFEGNNPLSLGQSSVYPPLVYDLLGAFEDQPDGGHLAYRLVAGRIEERELNNREVNAYWSGKARSFILDHPGRFLKLLAAKGFYFLNSFRRHDLAPLYRVDVDLDRNHIPALPFGALAALALIGMILLLPRLREFLPLYAIIAVQAAVVLTVYVSERQRFVALPFFIFFAAAAVDAMVRSPKRLLLLAAAVPVALTFNIKTDSMRDEIHRWERYRQADGLLFRARGYVKEKDLSSAAKASAAVRALAPLSRDYPREAYLPFPGGYIETALAEADSITADTPSARFDRAVLLLEAGRLDEADAVFEEMERKGTSFCRTYDNSSESGFYRGRIAMLKGDGSGALRLFGEALKRTPGDPFILARMAVLSHDGRYAELSERYFDKADAQFVLGQAFLDAGDNRAAAQCFAYVAKILPEYGPAWVHLAAALSRDNRLRDAVEAYAAGTKMRFGPLLFEPEILAAFKQEMDRSPSEDRPKYLYGLVLGRYGHFSRALEVFKSMADPAAFPDMAETVGWLEWAAGQGLFVF